MALVALRLPATTTLTMQLPFPLKPTKSPSFNMPPKLSSFSLINTTLQNTDTNNASTRKLPILLFDIMDTIVRDPFYDDVPPFFGFDKLIRKGVNFITKWSSYLRYRMSFEELIEAKHPTAWIEFEEGMIDETELARKFFKDGRTFDLEGLKNCMRRGYSYIDGIEALLYSLKENNYEMHAFTNYPVWYKIIEEKLNISRYLSWTFCSCVIGKRKPDPDFYLEVLRHLKADAANCIFVDDRLRNVEAAIDVGIAGVHFKNANLLRLDLSKMGIDISDSHVRHQPEFTEERTS